MQILLNLYILDIYDLKKGLIIVIIGPLSCKKMKKNRINLPRNILNEWQAFNEVNCFFYSEKWK